MIKSNSKKSTQTFTFRNANSTGADTYFYLRVFAMTTGEFKDDYRYCLVVRYGQSGLTQYVKAVIRDGINCKVSVAFSPYWPHQGSISYDGDSLQDCILRWSY